MGMNFRKAKTIGLSIILAMVFAVSLVKFHNVQNGSGIENIEASYHSLLIAKSLSERSISEHHLLPIITLGGDVNENIPWGAAVPDHQGGYIYTSFPTFGFLAPTIFINIFDLDYSIKILTIFNTIILIITTLVFYLFLIKSFNAKEPKDYILISLSFAPLILSRESIASNGMLYWPQSLSQLIIAILFLAFFYRLKNKTSTSLLVILFSFYLFAMTEWTGFVLGGLASIYFLVSKKNRDATLSLGISTALFGALLTFAVQLYLTLDLRSFISASITRFTVRSGGNADFLALFYGYYESFSLFILFLPVYIFLKVSRRLHSTNIINFALMSCAFLIVENIILAQHATSYTFDRLKLAFLLSIVFCELILKSKKAIKHIAFVILVAASALSFYSYKNDINKFSDWNDIQLKNIEIANKTKNTEGFNCARLFNNTRVRAYLNILFERSVNEYTPGNSELASFKNENCPVIMINGDIPYKDLQRITSVEVFRKGIKTETIE